MYIRIFAECRMPGEQRIRYDNKWLMAHTADDTLAYHILGKVNMIPLHFRQAFLRWNRVRATSTTIVDLRLTYGLPGLTMGAMYCDASWNVRVASDGLQLKLDRLSSPC